MISLSKKILENDAIIILFLMVLGIALRLVNIIAEPLWYDEVFSLMVAQHTQTMGELLIYVRELFHPPLYFIMMRYWTMWFGLNELAGRVFALIFSVGSIAGIYYLGRRIFTKEVALIAALLMAVSPLQVEFGQEARPYTILAFMALFSMYYFWNFLQDYKQTRNLLFITILNVIGLYLHYDYFILIAAQIGIVFSLRALRFHSDSTRKLFFKAIFWWGLQVLLFLPWFFYAFLPNLSGIHYALSLGVQNILNIFLEGDLWFNVQGTQEPLQSLLVFIGQVTVITVLGFSMRGFYLKVKEYGKFEPETLAIFFLFMWYAVSLIFYFVSPISSQYTPNWQRHILIFSPPLFLLIGYGLSKLTTTYIRFFILGIIILSAIPSLVRVLSNDADWSMDYNIEPLRYIEQYEQENDYIFIPGSLWEAFHLYHFKGKSDIGGFLPMKGYNSIDARNNYLLPAIEEAKYAYEKVPEEFFVGVNEMDRILEPYDRVWLISGTRVKPIFNWFISNWEFVDCPDAYCPYIYLFERPSNE